MSEWRDIKTAPKDGTTIAILTAKGRLVKAFWGVGICEGPYGSVSAWAAVEEDQHPPCWTDGICWRLNKDGEQSDPPILWIPLAVPPSGETP